MRKESNEISKKTWNVKKSARIEVGKKNSKTERKQLANWQ
jgi:hypothetical protein